MVKLRINGGEVEGTPEEIRQILGLERPEVSHIIPRGVKITDQDFEFKLGHLKELMRQPGNIINPTPRGRYKLTRKGQMPTLQELTLIESRYDPGDTTEAARNNRALGRDLGREPGSLGYYYQRMKDNGGAKGYAVRLAHYRHKLSKTAKATKMWEYTESYGGGKGHAGAGARVSK